MSSPEPMHLNNRQRDTLRQLLQHPASHNVDWRGVISLVETIGSVKSVHDGKLAVTIGSETIHLDPRGRKDLDIQEVADLRRLISAAGYSIPGH